MVKGVRDINTTFKDFIDPKTCQFLVNYSLLVLVPSNL